MSYLTARKGDIWPEFWADRTVSTLSPFSHLELGTRPFISLFQSAPDRGIVESATSKPSDVVIRRYVLGTGTHPALLLPTGTSGLLAVLQLGVWSIGTDCLWKRTRLLRGRTCCPLGKNGNAGDTYC